MFLCTYNTQLCIQKEICTLDAAGLLEIHSYGFFPKGQKGPSCPLDWLSELQKLEIFMK